jgi:hypothetical protein
MEPRTPPLPADPAVLTKSGYLDWRRCARLAWHLANRPEQIPPAPPADPRVLAEGQEITRLARELFPGGDLVSHLVPGLSPTQATARALRQRRPLFEATFSAAGVQARADVLAPADGGAWDLAEVKSGTKIKDQHLDDITFQARVLQACGLRLARRLLVHPHPEYVRQGALVPGRFLKVEDVTAESVALQAQVEAQCRDFERLRAAGEPPVVTIGSQCDDPEPCPLRAVCWRGIPEANVLTLVRGGKKAQALLAQGITALTAIPSNVRLTPTQTIQCAVARSGKPHVDQPALAEWLTRLRYPLSLLDFETFATAIPRFDGLRPYQAVPFQYSLHIVEALPKKPRHKSWLAPSAGDHRATFLRRLRAHLPAEGSIVVYHASFERGRLREACAWLPEHAAWLRDLEPRFLDLMEPFSKFHYLHPQQHGSASIKYVLPALTGRSYDHLAIRNGAMASQRFLEAMSGGASAADRKRVRADLKAYCGQDTLAMAWLLRKLNTLASPTARP